MDRRSIALLMASFVLGACATTPGTSGNAPTSTPAPTGTAAATGSAPADTSTPGAEVDMCSLMPLGDVQAKSPFQTPLATATPDVVKAGCTYRAALDAEEPVSVLLSVTTFDSQVDALTALDNHRQAAVDGQIPVDDIDGLGEKAFSAGSDEVGVHAVLGPLVIDANMKGEWPDTTDDAKVVAGTELVRLIILRLP